MLEDVGKAVQEHTVSGNCAVIGISAYTKVRSVVIGHGMVMFGAGGWQGEDAHLW